MKATASLFLSLLIIGLVLACSTPKPTYSEISVLKDVTDTQNIQLNSNEILNLYNVPENEWGGRIFNYSSLTDVGYNQEKHLVIKAENEWLSNELERNKSIQEFKDSIAGIIQNSNSATPGKANSSVYFPIARELNRLSKSKSERRILIIYSDLMENTPDLSFYRKEDFELVKNQPDSLQKQFERELAISPLEGIEVYFIYQPKDITSDQRFQIISEFYKKLLESKGAKVNISANLNF